VTTIKSRTAMPLPTAIYLNFNPMWLQK